MGENQLTKMLDKYPHLRDEKYEGEIFETLLEDELNGSESAMKLNMKYTREKMMRIKKQSNK